MSRKDFVAVAAAINNAVVQINNTYAGDDWMTQRNAALDGIRTTATNLAGTFADANPRFDRARFLAACGIK